MPVLNLFRKHCFALNTTEGFFWQRVHKSFQLYLLGIRHRLTLIPNSLEAKVLLEALEFLREQLCMGGS